MSAGVRHTQGYTDNDYNGTLQYSSQMKQADTYAYAQYNGKWGKLGYRLGMGVTRSWFQQIGQEDYETYSLNPRLNLTYAFNDQWSISLNGNVNTMNPSLSQLSAVEQLTDSLQSERGNPNLKPYSYYRSTFRLNYSKGNGILDCATSITTVIRPSCLIFIVRMIDLSIVTLIIPVSRTGLSVWMDV